MTNIDIKTEEEIWREIDFTNGNYSISNIGNVKSNGFYSNVGNRGKRWVRPRILKLQNNGVGYKFVALGRRGMFTIHRLVAEMFIPNPLKLEFVNHKNGIKTDNRIENLEWCTRQENEDHAYATGLKNSRGSNNTMAKLDEEKVLFILNKYGKINDEILCEMFCIHRVTLQRIVNRKIWKHVKYKKESKVIDSHRKQVVNIESGIFYDSIKEALDTTCFNKSTFHAMLKGSLKNKTSYILLQ